MMKSDGVMKSDTEILKIKDLSLLSIKYLNTFLFKHNYNLTV